MTNPHFSSLPIPFKIAANVESNRVGIGSTSMFNGDDTKTIIAKDAQAGSYTDEKPYCPEDAWIKDIIDHPSHYQGKDLEAIDVIEAFDLNFSLGNVIKYVLRAGKKGDRLQDLKKAMWYLSREIDGLDKR